MKHHPPEMRAVFTGEDEDFQCQRCGRYVYEEVHQAPPMAQDWKFWLIMAIFVFVLIVLVVSGA